MLSNTLRDTPKALPYYDGMGSEQGRFKTPAQSVVIDAEADEEDIRTLLG